MKHVPALDGLRGVAILLVMVAHAGVPGFGSGGVSGVTLFFVLSGFLITSLLAGELSREGRISLPGFYRRRALRLLPALLVLITAIALLAVIQHQTAGLATHIAATQLYAGNWVVAFGGSLGYFGHTWSLAIEEQFYLIWPVLLVIVRPVVGLRWRAMFALALVGATASFMERMVLWHGWQSHHRVYYGTDTRADALLLGCALALWITSGRKVSFSTGSVACGLLVLAFATLTAPIALVYVTDPLVAAVAGVLLIGWVMTPGRHPRVLCWWPLRQTGRISYGLYLWHIPVMWIVLPYLAGAPLALRALVLFALGYALAIASYVLVERHFLRLKDRPLPRWRPGLPQRCVTTSRPRKLPIGHAASVAVAPFVDVLEPVALTGIDPVAPSTSITGATSHQGDPGAAQHGLA